MLCLGVTSGDRGGRERERKREGEGGRGEPETGTERMW